MRKPWTEDSVGRLVVVIPPSVERVASLDDPEMLRHYDNAEWQNGRRVAITKRAFVDLVDSVLNLAGDQVHEDLSVGGALRWARRMTSLLFAAGIAQRDAVVGISWVVK